MSEEGFTDFEKAFQLHGHAYGDLSGKTGFELFKGYRDGILSMIDNKAFMESHETAFKDFNDVLSFTLVDQAYIDNFLLCAIIKLKADNAYDEGVAIIDKYIRPHPRSEGLSHLYKDAAGFFVFVLNKYQRASVRQSCHMAAQIFKMAASEVESRYSDIKKKFPALKKDELPPVIALLVLFGCLYRHLENTADLSPIKKHKRSQDEFNATLKAFDDFCGQVFLYFSPELKALENCDTQTILDIEIEDMDLRFLKKGQCPDNPDIEQVGFLLALVTCLKIMPNFLKEPLKYFGADDE